MNDIPEITGDELLKYLGQLAPNATITITTDINDVPVVFRYQAERLTLKDRIILFLRNPKKIITTVFVIWGMGLQFAPEWTPTFPKALTYAYDIGQTLFNSMDLSFPYHYDDTPLQQFVFSDMNANGEYLSGSTYSVPVTAFDLTSPSVSSHLSILPPMSSI